MSSRQQRDVGGLTDKGGDKEALKEFSALFYEWAPPEDLAEYDNTALEESARLAFAELCDYRKGDSIVSVNGVNKVLRAGRPVTIVTLINDNMPFLLDSVLGEIAERVSMVYLVLHPVLDVTHGKNGISVHGEASGPEPKGTDRVSVMQIHLPMLDQAAREELAAALKAVLGQVRAAVRDWKPMLARLDQAIKAYKANPPGKKKNVAEAIEFLEWLRDDNFIFLGMREYDYRRKGKTRELVYADKPQLGILSDPAVRVLRRGEAGTTATSEILAFLDGPEALIVTKANARSRVHRRVYLDYVGIKLFDKDGEVTGELRFVGLFTSTAYTRSVTKIPFLRPKVDAVIKQLGFNPQDHSGKALINVLEDYPRDELFQVDVDTLVANAERILALGERPRVRALPRIDPFGRFVSVLVYVPRDRYDSIVREKISQYLMRVYDGQSVEFQPSFPEGTLTRIYFIVRRDEGTVPQVARETLEAEIRAIVRTWEDAVQEAAESFDGGSAGIVALASSFPDSYREGFTPDEALVDAERIAELSANNPLYVDFYKHHSDGPDAVSLKIYHYGAALALSQRVPLLENMGFRVISEQTFDLPGVDGGRVHVHDMQLVNAFSVPVDLKDDGALLEEAFRAIWNGTADNDGYNALVQTARLSVREITILRAYGRYLQQAGIAYSQGFIAAALNRYPAIARNLFNLFDLRFNPARVGEDQRPSAEKKFRDEIDLELQSVPSLDDDQIVRRFLNLIEATLRTNAFVPEADGSPRKTLAFKLDPHEVEGLPDPRPWREIFVYGPEVEGVHLRFGPVARGGIRWSDRAQDYRTEVLGLVKAQQVKNAVIVPVGAKGGFYPKRLPSGDRNAIFEAGRQAYVTFISTLLSITDNIVGERVAHPHGVVRHDGDDPYFVVAADKGTATFSDTANAISQADDFWLDDAFASGGSAGYDHKKMGITARGAWEAVKRHFREMDIDIQTTPFTVAGVGDMSGDVFGNGMLLSSQTKLVAAFDHRDIFIDPNPDPTVTIEERQRLFNLPRSSWQDYDRSKISEGGGVYSRSLKTITLSPQAAQAIGITKTHVTPQELICAILKAPVDLLWFGGIGTYVRGNTESDAQVGDRANDAIRITGSDVRAKVIGEGANLAVTQRGRIEFSLLGGRCNTDAIDNSAGVNTSDVEVNIKIALAAAMRAGKLERPARNKLLAAMTDEVAALVLRNNYLQTLALSLAERRGLADLPYQARFMTDTERQRLLDRRIETLPDEHALKEREARGQALTRPELAVLLAYAKLVLVQEIVTSDLPDDPYFEPELFSYFPKRMVKPYAAEIASHRLRRDIIATLLGNDAINRGGPTFVSRLQDMTGKTPAEILRAYVAVRDGFELGDIYDAIDKLDNQVPGATQNAFYEQVSRMLHQTTAWVLRNHNANVPLGDFVEAIRQARHALEPRLPKLMPDFMTGVIAQDTDGFVVMGAPEALATRLAQLQFASVVPDIALVANRAKSDLIAAAKAYFTVTEAFRIGRIEEAARAIPITDYYDGMALARANDTIAEATRAIAVAALSRFGGEKDPAAAWLESGNANVMTTRQRMTALVEGGDLTVSRLAVAAGLMSDLAG
ncbi:NAD-glutamate dehydrogenase [Brucella endophytica]|uniref:NAD-glutamate dehydrogenase n=1 Tax=Brucella endophytica TaxID=1963359 RepID=A0A916SIU9_9HYPH|nr:NAD-glutamate dehydrogenase [Brucella endophytica]GGB03048.1 NAD-glutamate dehydrogenase [Brucella endophytica]